MQPAAASDVFAHHFTLIQMRTRSGLMCPLAAAAATFTYVDQTVANMRETNDAINGAA